MGPSSVDRTPHISRIWAQGTYARNTAQLASPTDYPSDPSEPFIEEKCKLTDARQLEELNATYNRTAFSSTEERAPLAKEGTYAHNAAELASPMDCPSDPSELLIEKKRKRADARQ